MTREMVIERKIYCIYFEKAICLRDDQTKCEECPYYKVYLDTANSK